jgi:predicted nucleic acid-binding protein
MTGPILIDSDVLIEVLRGRNPEILKRWAEAVESDALVVYSPVSSAEFWHAARASEAAAIEKFFTALTCIPIALSSASELANTSRGFTPAMR